MSLDKSKFGAVDNGLYALLTAGLCDKCKVPKMINTGGRNGEVHSPDKSFNLDIVAPGRKVEGATNPEQLFAAGYSACFNSALDYIKKSKNTEELPCPQKMQILI